ncbi:putative membrane protein [Methylobacterium sp. R2-1]|nr:putative membrane protein [Methylobacterium sp. R2-1]
MAGLRTMSACAALSWAAARGRTRSAAIPSGPVARTVATTAALAEMAGDKMPFAPDRRIPPSFAARLVIGAVGGWMFAGRRASPEAGALAGVAGAVAGTLLGRFARGGGLGAPFGLARGLAEDAAAASLAAALVASAERQQRVRPAPPHSL